MPQTATAPKFEFLTVFVLDLLRDSGLQLTEEQQNVYIPQIQALVERKLGLELLPKLNNEQLDQFADLVENQESTPEQFKTFWYAAVPKFEEEVAKVLEGVSEKAKETLGVK